MCGILADIIIEIICNKEIKSNVPKDIIIIIISFGIFALLVNIKMKDQMIYVQK